MSLKPPKKSDLPKDWMMKRRDNKRNISPEYHLIVTEGTKTEPEYFTAIKEKINEAYSERIQLKIYGEGDNTVNLFEKAKEYVKNNPNGYKHVWIVYDTDDFPKDKINVVPELCKRESNSVCEYHAVWSNQCIELWFLLHFSFMHADIERTEYFSKLTDKLQLLSCGDYSKNRKDMFSILSPYIDTAIRNAKKIDELNKHKTPANSAPGTKVFKLIEKLRPYIIG